MNAFGFHPPTGLVTHDFTSDMPLDCHPALKHAAFLAEGIMNSANQQRAVYFRLKSMRLVNAHFDACASATSMPAKPPGARAILTGCMGVCGNFTMERCSDYLVAKAAT